MTFPVIDLSSLRKALSQLDEALRFWHEQSPDAPLKRHLRAAVIQSFEFSYELSVRMLRRVLVERAEQVASGAAEFLDDALALLRLLEKNLES